MSASSSKSPTTATTAPPQQPATAPTTTDTTTPTKQPQDNKAPSSAAPTTPTPPTNNNNSNSNNNTNTNAIVATITATTPQPQPQPQQQQQQTSGPTGAPPSLVATSTMQPPPPNNTNNQQQQQVPVSPAPSLMMQQQQPPGGGGSQAALPPPPQPQLQLHLQPSSGHIGGGGVGVGVGGVQAQLQLQLQMQQPQLQLQLQPTPMTVQPPAPMMTSISPQMVRQVTTLKAGPGQPYQQLQIQLGTQQYQTIQQQQHLLMVQQQQQTLQQQQILQQPQPSQAVMNNIQHQTSQPQSLPSSQQPQPMQVTSTTTSPSVRAAPHLSQSVITENGVTYFNLPRPMHEQCTKPTTATMMLQPRSFPMPGISSRDLTEDLPPDSLCAKLFGVFYSANGTVHTFTFFPKQPLKLTLWSHRDYMCYPPGFYENEPFCFGPNNCCEFAETFPVDLGDTNTRAECLRQNSLLSFIWESMDLEALTRPKSPPLRLDHWQRPALRICKGEHITITIFEATS